MRETISTLEIAPGDGINIKLGESLLRITAGIPENHCISSEDMDAIMDSIRDNTDQISTKDVTLGYTNNALSLLLEGGRMGNNTSAEILLNTDGTWVFVDSMNNKNKYYGNIK